MVGLIAELPPGVQLGIVTADEAVQIEPAVALTENSSLSSVAKKKVGSEIPTSAAAVMT